MAKERKVRILLNFLCEGEEGPPELTPREQSGNAIERVDTFIDGEDPGSIYSYAERRRQDSSIKLEVDMLISVTTKAQDDSIETKLDNNLDLFPPLYPGTKPRFFYMSDGTL